MSSRFIDRVVRVKIDPSLISESIGFEVATHFYKIYYEAEESAHNPIYRAILERLNKLLKAWLNRNIGLKTFKQELESIERELLRYKEAISGKSREDKIVESIRFYINEHLGDQIQRISDIVDFLVETYIIPEVKRFEKSGDVTSGSV